MFYLPPCFAAPHLTIALLGDRLHVYGPLQFTVQHHIQVFVMSMSVPSMQTETGGGLFLLKSTTISFVFTAFSCRWFSPHHFTKLPTRSLCSLCESSPIISNSMIIVKHLRYGCFILCQMQQMMNKAQNQCTNK